MRGALRGGSSTTRSRPVGRPTGNAVVERFIRTLEEELIWLRDWDSADELRAAIATWLHHYAGGVTIAPYWKRPPIGDIVERDYALDP